VKVALVTGARGWNGIHSITEGTEEVAGINVGSGLLADGHVIGKLDSCCFISIEEGVLWLSKDENVMPENMAKRQARALRAPCAAARKVRCGPARPAKADESRAESRLLQLVCPKQERREPKFRGFEQLRAVSVLMNLPGQCALRG
jgi:hypothetical protein